MRITIDMRGVQDAFKRAPQAILAEMGRGAKEGLTDIQRSARQRHRFKSRSGHLARAIKMDFKSFQSPGRGLFIDSGVAPYGGWVHDGTRPHKIAPKNKAALSFIGKGGKHFLAPRNMGRPSTRRYWKGQASLTGATLIGKGYVNHPGTKPDQFIYDETRRGTPNLINKINAGIGKAIVKLGLKGRK